MHLPAISACVRPKRVRSLFKRTEKRELLFTNTS
nr:MAG TPA: hypothetical protein [Caudoviricetes sp.]